MGQSVEGMNPLGTASAVSNDDLIEAVLFMPMLHPRHDGFGWHHCACENTIVFAVDQH
jgi:hypothetical protein